MVRALEQTELATIAGEMPPQDMLSLGIHPRILQPATFPPFDLYAPPENGNGFRLFRAAGEPVYLNTWQKLDREGVELLYIRSRDRARCLEYVEQHLPALLEDNALPDGHLAQWVYLVAGQAMEGLFRDPDSTPRHHRVRRLVAAILDVMETDRFCAQHMLDSASVSYSTHTHCVNVCVLLTSFARNVLGVRDRRPLTEIALGGILHDIGKVMVPAAILRKRGELTRAEFAKIRQHPANSIEIGRPFLRRRVIAQRIMAQHHENADGGGYPEGRSGQSIHMFARVARLADAFDALTSHRPYGEAADQYQALNTMAVEMRGAFDEVLLRKFIRYAAAAFRRDSAFVPLAGEAAEGEALSAGRGAPAPASPAIVPGPAFGLETWEESAQIPGPGDARTAEADTAPFLRHTLNAIEELMSQENERVALMGGILNALQETVAGYLRGDVRTTLSGAQPLRTRTARLAAVEPVRPLFPLVWQLDEWRESFALPGDESPDAARLREDV
ncbi:MAG: HD domain-containing protein, partial [Candidatus Brocadiae bacterium]|nr:HD domain-containing protein [Candidatus Brocadiia bacterium]